MTARKVATEKQRGSSNDFGSTGVRCETLRSLLGLEVV